MRWGATSQDVNQGELRSMNVVQVGDRTPHTVLKACATCCGHMRTPGWTATSW